MEEMLKQILLEIRGRLDNMDENIDNVDERIDNLCVRIHGLEETQSRTYQRLERIDDGLERLYVSTMERFDRQDSADGEVTKRIDKVEETTQAHRRAFRAVAKAIEECC